MVGHSSHLCDRIWVHVCLWSADGFDVEIGVVAEFLEACDEFFEHSLCVFDVWVVDIVFVCDRGVLWRGRVRSGYLQHLYVVQLYDLHQYLHQLFHLPDEVWDGGETFPQSVGHDWSRDFNRDLFDRICVSAGISRGESEPSGDVLCGVFGVGEFVLSVF